MILSSLCPKCRAPIPLSAARCRRCSYRLSPWETRKALLTLIGAFLAAAFFIGCLIAFVGHH